MKRKYTAVLLTMLLLFNSAGVYGSTAGGKNPIEPKSLPLYTEDFDLQTSFDEDIPKTEGNEGLTAQPNDTETILPEEWELELGLELDVHTDEEIQPEQPEKSLFMLARAGVPVINEADLKSEIESIAALGGGTITLDKDFDSELTDVIEIDVTQNTDLTIEYPGTESFILYGKNARHFQFNLASGSTLTLTLDNVILDGENTAGGIEITGGSSDTAFVFAGGVIQKCKATFGGGVYSESNIEISGDAQINENTAEIFGGGVFGSGSIEISGEAQISENKATSGGGVFGSMGSTIEISGEAQISENKATSGGGVFGYMNSTIEISGEAQISENTADTGGGVYGNTGSTIEIRGEAQISENTAEYEGGGVFGLSGSTIKISGDAQIIKNEANLGGGVFGESNIKISESAQIIKNEANTGGGVFGSSTIKIGGEAQISENTAEYEGGGVYGYIDSTIEISGEAQINENTATGNGGGICILNINSLQIEDNVKFGNNLAQEGYLIEDTDPNFNKFMGIQASEPFENILNNYDVNYEQNIEKTIYSAVFMANDGTDAVYTHIVTESSDAPLAEKFPTGTPQYPGYNFINWNTDPKGEGNLFTKDTPMPYGSLRLYAQWEKSSTPDPDPKPTPEPQPDPNPTPESQEQARDRDNSPEVYKVTFETGGGTLIRTKNIVSGGTITRPSKDPVRFGYIFTNWYSDSNCKKVYDFSNKVKENLTLYAGWEKIEQEEPKETGESTLQESPSFTTYIAGYPDNTFRPNEPVRRGEGAVMLYGITENKSEILTDSNFTDIQKGEWYENAVTALTAQGIVTGYPDGTYKPNQPLTRAEFILMALNFMNEEESTQAGTFADTGNHWAQNYIQKAYELNLVTGYPDGTFKPDETITRAEAVIILNKITGNTDLQAGSPSAPFTDLPQDHWAYDEILKALIK